MVITKDKSVSLLMKGIFTRQEFSVRSAPHKRKPLASEDDERSHILQQNGDHEGSIYPRSEIAMKRLQSSSRTIYSGITNEMIPNDQSIGLSLGTAPVLLSNAGEEA